MVWNEHEYQSEMELIYSACKVKQIIDNLISDTTKKKSTRKSSEWTWGWYQNDDEMKQQSQVYSGDICP
jgi:hypothetical protein